MNERPFTNIFSYEWYKDISFMLGMVISAILIKGTVLPSYYLILILSFLAVFPLCVLLLKRNKLQENNMVLFELKREYLEIIIEFLTKIGAGIVVITLIRGIIYNNDVTPIVYVMLVIGGVFYLFPKFYISKTITQNERDRFNAKNK